MATAYAKRKAEREARKKSFQEFQSANVRKGQQGMTLKQRQADDDRIGRKALIKKSGKNVKQRIAKMESSVSARHGTNKENLKSIKAGNRVGQAGAIVKHHAGNVGKSVLNFFKPKKIKGRGSKK